MFTFEASHFGSDIKLNVYVKKIIKIQFIKTEKKKKNYELSSEDDSFQEEEDYVYSDDSQDSQGSQDTNP